jgi:hypothetical protein
MGAMSTAPFNGDFTVKASVASGQLQFKMVAAAVAA